MTPLALTDAQLNSVTQRTTTTELRRNAVAALAMLASITVASAIVMMLL